MTTTSAAAPVKHQVVDKIPKRFKRLKFGIQSNQDIVNQGVMEVSDRNMYDMDRGREPTVNGVLDKRLGTSSKTGQCTTCGLKLQDCSGHFGHVRLPLPAFHIGYIKFTISILQEICKDCSRVLLIESERRSFLAELRRPGIDNMRRVAICKKINELCRKVKHCPYCGAVNGQIRKVGALKLVHDKFVAFNKSTSVKKQPPPSKVMFDNSFNEARKHVNDLDKHLRKAFEDLNPLRVLNLFKQISLTDCELLGLNPSEGRPEMFLWQYLPAPPVCIRPSVAQEGASNEDDLTTRLGDIVFACGLIRAALQKGTALQTIMEQWEYLQLQIAVYVNSDVPGLQQSGVAKTMRGFCQRLKGKQGRFRGNLSGKRVDFSGRTVISPDPNLAVNEVAVPELVAKNLTYPERAHRDNLEKLRQCILRGPAVWPGAQAVLKQDGDHPPFKVSLRFADKETAARDLRVGDVVERHLEDGDIVLFNRQPSLHRLSIMCHLAKVRPWRTFRLNECACGPYNADFDGDEMNLHVPQTEEARAEALTLMGVKHNLATPKNGEPIIAATQDFITAAYVLSTKDNFYDRRTFTYLVMHMMDGATHLDIPPPAIMAPKRLWTGKQLFSMLLRPNKSSPVKINLDAKCREYSEPPKPLPGKRKRAPDMCPNDGWLVVRNSVVMCGRMDKSTVGAGKKDSIFYVLLRDFGPDAAIAAMNRLAKLCARALTNQGFSIGIGDVYPTASLTEAKNKLVEEAYIMSDDLIKQFNENTLPKAPGCTMEETLESKISGALSKVRQNAGDLCIASLSRNNAPWIMASSGSKGSNINVAQMVAAVGQQIIGGSRVADGFQDRTLPHFHKNTRHAPAKGFVRNSFYTGLLPTEFLFHAISGREGLVDTAVKTAETGYMSRRLMKSLEDLSTQYDDTVRTSAGGVVQFEFGADKLDPLDMEGKAKPVNFARTFSHSENLTWNNTDRSLLPFEVLALCNSLLRPERERRRRRGLLNGEPLKYEDQSDYAIDEKDSGRKFLDTIVAHVTDLAKKLARFRRKAGLQGMRAKPTNTHLKSDKMEHEQLAKLSAELDQLERKVFSKPESGDEEKEYNRLKELIYPPRRAPQAKMEIDEESSDEEASDDFSRLKSRAEELEFKQLSRNIGKGEKEDYGQLLRIQSKIDDLELNQLSRIASEIEKRERGKLSRLASERVAKISENTLRHFVGLCLEKFNKAHVEPGHAVGAVGAQSIGEPGTQMTLKTFHFAGVAGMSITQGVPRIKEIINASKTISTPIITCPLQNETILEAAKVVRARIEKTYIEDIVRYIDDEWQQHRAFITLHINMEVMEGMHLGVTLGDISKAILKQKKLKIPASDIHIFEEDATIEITVRNPDTDAAAKRAPRSKAAIAEAMTDLSVRVSHLKRVLPSIAVSGHPEATRAIVQQEPVKNSPKKANGEPEMTNTILVEGYGLRQCMNTEGVIGEKVISNSVVECRDVLGIEAARTTIAKEINTVMGDMDIDPRHMQLLADVMTFKGEILGITRFGLAKMRDSVLQLASFEKTSDHLFDAAIGMKNDPIEGVSEKIIMGETMSVGTGAFEVVRKLGLGPDNFAASPTVFEDAWAEEQGLRRKSSKLTKKRGL
ncbi:Uu.00g099910.m01.CDS01 [Anthostomella pinea]|uniref:DNA-directed RNA polymerase subunit n=1 Tax=Anthostomella pinea TaxID=933095 RepID=A0AAI8VDF1_9PEZI|nr:Uu.00g099910.m01.CDS01 [Anthostomella pinea]